MPRGVMPGLSSHGHNDLSVREGGLGPPKWPVSCAYTVESDDFALCFPSWCILLPFLTPLRLFYGVVTISNRWEFENIGKSIEGKPLLLVELNTGTLLAPGFAWKHGISLNLTRIQADCLRHASVPCLFRWSVKWSWKVKWWNGRYNFPQWSIAFLWMLLL